MILLNSLTGIAFNILERELDLVLGRDVFPSGKEDFLLHVAVLPKEDVDGDETGEVEDVDVVLDSNLDAKNKKYLAAKANS